MGIRGELFSKSVSLPNRTYFFNVKENRMGDIYLNIVESKNRDAGGFDRQSVIVFAEDLQEFLKGFDESLRVLEKSVREKRHSGRQDSEGKRSEDKRSEGRGGDAKRSYGKHSDGRRTESKPMDGKRYAVKRNSEKRGDNARSYGKRSESNHSDSARGEGRRGEGKRIVARKKRD